MFALVADNRGAAERFVSEVGHPASARVISVHWVAWGIRSADRKRQMFANCLLRAPSR